MNRPEEFDGQDHSRKENGAEDRAVTPYHDPYGGPWQNPYSPYAAPVRKKSNGLIIGIVAGIILLFLIAVFALTYKTVSLLAEKRGSADRDSHEEQAFQGDGEQDREKFDFFFDDYGNGPYYDDSPFYGGDPYFGDGWNYGKDPYDDDGRYYDDGHAYDNDQYYTLHDDIKTGLSYSVDFDDYEYEPENENVEIVVSYPVIKGDKVPNLAHLNDVIAEEADLFKEYYEEEYAEIMDHENGYFSALSSGYVTYMDEEKLSIVFAEYLYTDYYNEAFLYSINIDMENGVILDNENMLSLDDDFSVEFRKKSDVQNGEIAYLTGMTDQEITGYFNSSNVIVFYTPLGMEIGFNYDAGWVTVTYGEYEKYLKVF